MFTITIHQSFTKSQGIKMPVRCRTSNKEKSDLTPMNALRPFKSIIGMTKGTANTVEATNRVNGALLVRNLTLDNGLNARMAHQIVGRYEFEKLNSSIEKGIGRDLIAMKVNKAGKALVKIAYDGRVVFNDVIGLSHIDSAKAKVKQTILHLIKINKTFKIN